MFIRLPETTLGDIYQPIHIQIAGMYPLVVIVVINSRSTMASHQDEDSRHSRSSKIIPWEVASVPPDATYSGSGGAHVVTLYHPDLERATSP
jgi:hypothetical protein